MGNADVDLFNLYFELASDAARWRRLSFPGFRDPDVLDFLFRPYCENGDWIAHEES